MDTPRDALAENITALKEALASERAKALDIAAELAVALAKASEDRALIAQQKLQIAKLQRQIYGQRSERSSLLRHAPQRRSFRLHSGFCYKRSCGQMVGRY
jgi:transposase